MEELRIIKQVSVPAAEITLRSDGIIRFEIREGYEITIPDVKQMTEVAGEIGGGKKFPNLIIMPVFENISYQVRDYTAGKERSRFTKADAFVISSMAMQLIGNFYLHFHKPTAPTKIFTQESAAVEWLLQFAEPQR